MRRWLIVLLLTASCWSAASVALAHPLGNFTANTFTRVTVAEEGVALRYVLDLAELPTVQARQRIDADGDDVVSPAERTSHADTRCAELADGVRLQADGATLPVTVDRVSLEFPEGDAGLPTLRLTCRMAAAAPLATGATVRFEDTNQPGRIGWREVVADGPLAAEADVPGTSLSDELRAYPEDRAPLAVTTATITVGAERGDDPLAGLTPTAGIPALERASSGLADLMARQQLTLGFVLLAVLVATVLGATHALAPGHGKTVMAAYLVSREGTVAQMFGLGTTVAVTHTLGVLALGVAVTASQAFAPERLYPWLGVVSGLLFAAIGVWLLLRARTTSHSHSHGHTEAPASAHTHVPVAAHAPAHAPLHALAHDHAPTPGGHDHGHDHGRAVPDGDGLGWRTLVLPGLAGGMLPSPSALVVLVAGIALGRMAFGLALVLAYGVGMALTLMLAGLLLVRLRTTLLDRITGSGRWARVAARLPTITASLVVLGGLAIAARATLTI